jgi:hypothetical protein
MLRSKPQLLLSLSPIQEIPHLILQSPFKTVSTGFRIWLPCTTRDPGATSGLQQFSLNKNPGYRDLSEGLGVEVAPRQEFKCGVSRSGNISAGYDDCQLRK